jgi:malate dehydrogenase (oxaloacetate-decarboxylating)
MLIAAAEAIADAVRPEELNPSYIVPSVFDPTVAPAVAAAIRQLSGAADAASPLGSAVMSSLGRFTTDNRKADSNE